MYQLATDLAANDDALAGPAHEEAHAPPVARKAIGSLGVTDALAGFAPARKGAGGDDGGDEGIETEGEDEAEADRVEAAVKQGKKAKRVLGAEAEGDEQEAEGEAEAGAAPAAAVGAKPPARKRLQLKESGSKFSTGMTFSKTGLEKSASYKI